MSGETARLAEFAANLSCADIPSDAVQAAKVIALDAVAVGTFGSGLAWCRRFAETVLRERSEGHSPLLGSTDLRTGPRMAALINGTFVHSFEFDSLRFPNAGVHAGSTVWPAVLALASEHRSSGAEAVAALVAGCEVAFRIGLSAKGAFEKIGFHAPGVTGAFGAAAAAGKLLKLDAHRMANAFGIAGSMCAGLLAFSKSGTGGAVKPIHMGRAAEAGVLAAELAAGGYEGPGGILEGKFGVLEAYARDADPSELTADLGSRWETRTICVKKYPCHVTAQTVVEGVRELVARNRITPSAVEAIELGVSEKALSHHAGREPRDVGNSQYSVPMCAAIALHHDPQDPEAFLRAHENASIRDWASRIRLVHLAESVEKGRGLMSRVNMLLKSGAAFEITKSEFEGMHLPQSEKLALRKFENLTVQLPEAKRSTLSDSINHMETLIDFQQLFGSASADVRS